MTSRLMLSLKKAVVDPEEPWSLVADLGQGKSVLGGSILLESRVTGGLDGILRTSFSPNEEGVELPPLDFLGMVGQGNNPSIHQCLDIENWYGFVL